jgi:enamine deaminase RidA (YjgF/YER057c/UK114 family)
MIDSFNPENVWRPFGAFSMGVLQGPGQIVHLKGQVSLNSDGAIVGKGNMRSQTQQVLENIQSVLSSVGGEMKDIFSLTHYVTDIDEFMKTGDIRMAYFRDPFPVTTTVQVVRLYDPELLIEITGIAEIPLDRFKRPVSGER